MMNVDIFSSQNHKTPPTLHHEKHDKPNTDFLRTTKFSVSEIFQSTGNFITEPLQAYIPACRQITGTWENR